MLNAIIRLKDYEQDTLLNTTLAIYFFMPFHKHGPRQVPPQYQIEALSISKKFQIVILKILIEGKMQ